MEGAANPMTGIRLDKVVLNIGIGSNDNNLVPAKLLLKKLTGMEAAPTLSKRRDPSLKVRKGQIIGAKVSLRGEKAKEILTKLLDANDSLVKGSSITVNTFNFGIKEYIDISGVKYDSKIGMMGLHVNASFARPGKRVQERKKGRSKVGVRHNSVSKEEILDYLKDNFKAKVAEE